MYYINPLAGTIAVQNLRLQKHAKGIPFMINDKSLPAGQCYLEYPDMSIALVKMTQNGQDFETISLLTAEECALLRTKHRL